MSALLGSVKTILIDLSGTLHIDQFAIPGAIDALKRFVWVGKVVQGAGLRQSNIPIKFVTNTTKESRRCLHERLVQMGFDIEPQEIWTSLWAARDLLGICVPC
ncbi:unnamed protein product [Timema podura]|uniref:Uncharacterized protein n=1 Tax=Timema podura TaxID=61482 RepID=A0ABN7NVT4_TIMPD|nr:unnamed protein product [Timema podura]